MFIKFAILMSAILLPTVTLAESVTTTDGRIITLNEDGTYIIETHEVDGADKYVEILDSLFGSNTSEYGEQSIRFMPKFRNISEKPIVGLKFKAEFMNAFGDEIWTTNGDISERVAQNSTSSASVFYNIKDNPFIGGEAYDKLLPMVSGDTGSIKISIVGIAFEGGEVVTFE